LAIETAITFESTSRKAKLGDVTVHWNEAGSGEEVLIALHGSGPGVSGWSNFKGNLPDFAGRFRTLLVDQPGFGWSDKPVIEGSTITYSARTVKALMDHLGIEKAHLLGNSYGGGVATKMVLDYPEAVAKLVLMGPGGVAHVLFSPDPTEGISVLRDFFAEPTKENLARFVRVMVWDRNLATPELIEERWNTVNNPETLFGFRQAVMPDPEKFKRIREEQELWRHLEKINHQVLMIWGRDDRVVPLDAAFFALRRLRNSRLHIFSRCGHWAQVEKREEFNRLVIDFLTH
jgi:4,5:9,10-diseco-3-hydroxy-5,9,17-trioxoandrosta-1(10),2-diene-4-oate hydrolase